MFSGISNLKNKTFQWTIRDQKIFFLQLFYPDYLFQNYKPKYSQQRQLRLRRDVADCALHDRAAVALAVVRQIKLHLGHDDLQVGRPHFVLVVRLHRAAVVAREVRHRVDQL